MSDEEVLAKYEEMREHYGDLLPHPEHEPIRFAYYVRLFRYHKERTVENVT